MKTHQNKQRVQVWPDTHTHTICDTGPEYGGNISHILCQCTLEKNMQSCFHSFSPRKHVGHMARRAVTVPTAMVAVTASGPGSRGNRRSGRTEESVSLGKLPPQCCSPYTNKKKKCVWGIRKAACVIYAQCQEGDGPNTTQAQAAGADNPAAPGSSRIIYLNRVKRRSEMRSDMHSGMSLGGRIIVSPVASDVFFKDIFSPWIAPKAETGESVWVTAAHVMTAYCLAKNKNTRPHQHFAKLEIALYWGLDSNGEFFYSTSLFSVGLRCWRNLNFICTTPVHKDSSVVMAEEVWTWLYQQNWATVAGKRYHLCWYVICYITADEFCFKPVKWAKKKM